MKELPRWVVRTSCGTRAVLVNHIANRGNMARCQIYVDDMHLLFSVPGGSPKEMGVFSEGIAQAMWQKMQDGKTFVLFVRC